MSQAGQRPAELPDRLEATAEPPPARLHGPSRASSLPGPAKQRRACTRQGHDPGEGNAHDGMVLPEAEVAHGLADHYVSFDSQDNQRPESNFTCTGEREGWGHRDFEQQGEKNALMAAEEDPWQQINLH